MLKVVSFLKVEFGKTSEILENLRQIPEVVKVATVTGDYDMLIEIEVEDSEALAQIFMKKVDIIEGIKDIHSNYVMRVWQK